jgi:hypothetical protein
MHRRINKKKGAARKRQKTAAAKTENVGGLHQPTNKASIGRKAALGLRQIAALMASSPSL